MGFIRNSDLAILSQQTPPNLEAKSHRALCYRAACWLVSTKRCQVVMVEKGSAHTAEMPDAIGWRGEESYLIEVKVSRADFLSDAKKPHRADGKGMGMYRYYMAPQGMISPSELPPGWGLIYETDKGSIGTVKGASILPHDEGAERALLVSALKTPEKLYEFWRGFEFGRFVEEGLDMGRKPNGGSAADFIATLKSGECL